MVLFYQKLNDFKLNREIIHLIVVIKKIKNSNKLNKILEARRSKISFIDPTIEDINKRTDRVIKGKVTKEFQFVTNQGKFVKKRNCISYSLY